MSQIICAIVLAAVLAGVVYWAVTARKKGSGGGSASGPGGSRGRPGADKH